MISPASSFIDRIAYPESNLTTCHCLLIRFTAAVHHIIRCLTELQNALGTIFLTRLATGNVLKVGWAGLGWAGLGWAGLGWARLG